MMNFTLGDIETAVSGQLVLKNGVTADTKVTSVVLDSRQVTDGGVFIATPGAKRDGNEFVKDVFDKGVLLVITEKSPEVVEKEFGIPASVWGSYLQVEDSFAALKKIGEAYRESLTIPVVGITGSVGKTSTKEFIAGVLSRKFRVLKTETNYNNEVGVPLTLLRIRPEHEVAVVEMGISDFGEMSRLTKMAKPDIAVITNIGQCHLENLKTRDDILKAKTEIFESMKPDGEVCLLGEDDKLSLIESVAQIGGKAPHFFGTGDNSKEEVWVSDICQTFETDLSKDAFLGSHATLHFNFDSPALQLKESMPIDIPLPGYHMVINAGAAACVAALLGLTPEEIREGIRSMQPIAGRNRIVKCDKYLLIDDCYNANPVSMKSSIDLLQMAKCHTVAILGDMFELGEEERELHAQVGAYAANALVNLLICVGDLSRSMYDAAKQAGGAAMYFATKADLLEALSKDRAALIPDGSAVLVKASHGMEFPEVVQLLQKL